jgi:hypothetical protein
MAAFNVGDIVDSMYGRCRVDKKKEGTKAEMYECTPLHWVLAQKCVPVFNLNVEGMKKVSLVKGTEVRCNYGGKGVINEVREVAGVKHYVVTLKNWQLAQGQSPTLYLDPQSVAY